MKLTDRWNSTWYSDGMGESLHAIRCQDVEKYLEFESINHDTVVCSGSQQCYLGTGAVYFQKRHKNAAQK
jgi:hypothetical protein